MRALRRIARGINRREPGAIRGVWSASACDLHRNIRRHLNIADERYWPGEAGRLARAALRPLKDPIDPRMLSTNDHFRILRQYEEKYPDFEAFGALPSDFCRVPYGQEVCHLRLRTMLSAGKRCLAVVFNTDPSTRGGKHWVLLWVDLRAPGPAVVAFIDSEGGRPKPAVLRLMRRLQSQAEAIHRDAPWLVPPPHPRGPLVTVRRRHRHQIGGDECGIYAVFFVDQLLRGVPVNHLSGLYGRIPNDAMRAWFLHELFPRQKKLKYA